MSSKVLIVDDQEGIRRLLYDACALFGYEVVMASSGTDALQVLKKEKIKVALVDMKMPGLNGLETLEEMRKIQPEITALLMTGYGESQLVEDAMQKGVLGVIKKPFDIDEIQGLLAKAMEL